ncbi:MAG: CxC ATPase DNA modification system associated small protein [Alphaproteobacteria bacterium]
MALDPELEDAIRAVVKDEKQPAAVAQRLIAWLKGLSDGEMGQEDRSRHLESVRNALKLDEAQNEN